MIFSHQGDTGDLIAALPYVQMQNGGDLLLYAGPGAVREPFTPAKVELLKPLLELQEYVHSVAYAEQPQGVILDRWRRFATKDRNITDSVTASFNAPDYARNVPWLKCDQNPIAPIVMARSPRYRQSHDLWKRLTSTYKDKVFVGLKAEHEDFENRFGPIPFYPTTDYYQLCRVIAGAQIFIGNQSCPLHLALGMLKTVVVEECSHCNNCFWNRPNAYYFRDDKGELPKID